MHSSSSIQTLCLSVRMTKKHVLQVFATPLALLIVFASLKSLSAIKISMAQPNCPETCGNVTIPYPFGIGDPRCFLDPSYEISCNYKKSVSRPYLRQFNLEVIDIKLRAEYSYMIVNAPIYSTCRDGYSWNSTDFRGSAFSFSGNYNDFYSVGCANTNTLFKDYYNQVLAGCASICGLLNSNSTGCYGINCCLAAMLDIRNFDFYTLDTSAVNKSACTYAFLAGRGGYSLPSEFSSNPNMIKDMDHIPVYLNWGIKSSVYKEINAKDTSILCYMQDDKIEDTIYTCQCRQSYNLGNPYIKNRCQVGDRCKTSKGGWEEDAMGGFYCDPTKKKKIIMAGTMGGGALILALFIFCVGFIKIFKKMRKLRLQRKFYKRNGGLLLQQKFSTNEVSLDTIRNFKVRELEKATENFNISRVLGQGGQGTVYKGMLTDGNIVAVKKSKLVDESQVEPFINEVVILSQINHRNIVKLLGCCLETKVPLLVYEHISNGTLSQLIRNQEEFPLSWEMRLRIASEVSGALAYLHASASKPIYHRDIKSSNILLDDKYRAKVADFGTSRSVAIDQTHFTTVVQGTFGYLDPEYFRSSQFTDKSDVYSFGVVLAELLTGERPIMLRGELEEKSLVAIFISSLEEDTLFQIVDERVAREGDKDEITTLAILASRCLNMNGKQRPAMKEVMLEIEKIRKRHLSSNVGENVCNNQSIIGSNVNQEDNVSSPSFSDYTESLACDSDPILRE